MRVPALKGTHARALVAAVVLLLAAAVCLAEAPPEEADKAETTAVILPCSIEANNCQANPKDLRQGAEAYWRGSRAREKDHAEAFRQFEEAVRLVPGNVDYVNAQEWARSVLVQDHLDKGNRLLDEGNQVHAEAEFRAALELDPSNTFAQQRLTDALGDDAPQLTPGLQLAARSDPVDLKPRPGRQDFHYRGDSRGLYELIARSFGLKVAFDTSFVPRPIRFEVEDIDFFKAVQLAGMVSKSFWVPMSESDFFVAADTVENHRQFDRMSLLSFSSLGTSTPQELNDVVSLLRGVFDIRLISANAAKNTITVRAPRDTLDAAAEFIRQFSKGPPQVMLDIQAFEVDHMVLRNLGVQLPLTFQMFNLSSAALALAGAGNIQQLINQLFSSGGINQANTTAITALLAQVQQQQLSPLLNTPFFTFGGGITLFAVTVPPATVNFSLNSSTVKILDHMTLRAMQGKAATMRVGSRYPVLNATFAPIYNTAAISQVLQNNTFQAAFPSVSYEDLGLSVKATPSIHGDADVTLELETDMKALTGQAFNGVPVISNRAYKGSITLKNGETAVVVGDINRSEQVSLSGLPVLGAVPGLGLLTANQNKTLEDDELMLVITPHILDPAREEGRALWLSSSR